MREIWDYVGALFKKTREMLTGGLIALYLVVQPYTSLPSPPRRIFWALIGAAWAVASFRVWRDERREKANLTGILAAMTEAERNAELHQEDPRIALYVRFPDDNPLRRPLRLFARNQGRLRLRCFQLKTLNIGLYSVSFDEVAELVADIDQPITYHMPSSEGQPDADILDLLMIDKPSAISPLTYLLRAEVQKINGQRRGLSYSISYAPLQNPRRVIGASEFNFLMLIEQI
jgi:hypothetical protein